MSEAFVYMFVVASGASSGVAVVGFVSYRLFVFMQRREVPNKKKIRRKEGLRNVQIW